MAPNTLPLNAWLLTMNEKVVEASVESGRVYLEKLVVSSSVYQLNKDTFRLRLGEEWTFDIRTNTIPWFETSDGGVVTDFCLQTREFLLALCAPLLGRRYDQSHRTLADWYRGVLVAFMSGAESGGAVYAFKKWHISQRWLPIIPPQVLPVEGALYDDPFSIIARTFQAGDNLRAENITKAMKISVDPLYHMYRVAGTTTLTIPSYEFIDVKEAFKDWAPTLTHAGGDAMDVITREGTFGAGDTEVGDWRTSAFDEHSGSGRVGACLQTPVVFDQPFIGCRLKKGPDGVYWFVKSDRDLRLSGAIQDPCVELLNRIGDLKISWICQRLGVKLQVGAKVTALYASPLYFCQQPTQFKKALDAVTKRWTVSAEALAWVRSDPGAPQGLLRFSDVIGLTVSEAWLSLAEAAALSKKGFFNG